MFATGDMCAFSEPELRCLDTLGGVSVTAAPLIIVILRINIQQSLLTNHATQKDVGGGMMRRYHGIKVQDSDTIRL